MAAIAGIAAGGHRSDVMRMLNTISHRGKGSWVLVEHDDFTLGMIQTRVQQPIGETVQWCVSDPVGEGYCTQAYVADTVLRLQRDPLGVAPLYYGSRADGAVCFASEVKALLEFTRDAHELLPGTIYDGQVTKSYYHLQLQSPWIDSPASLARELRRRLNMAIQRHIYRDSMGVLLSGGLDSSALVALARPHVKTLHTFVVGLKDAPDFQAARDAANYCKSEHHEVIVTPRELLSALPTVIFHLESFDALLVRSSIMNYLVARAASDYVEDIFSGEGGDELFAGYPYLQSLPMSILADELIQITNRLHNTALQRVDRCAAAHGLTAHTCYLDPTVIELAIRVPIELKINNGVAKWIVRQAIQEMLPQYIVYRPKSRGWEAAGVGDILAAQAEQLISNVEFKRWQTLPNGWVVDSKGELMYYRIFHDYFGDLPNLAWMGRTKNIIELREPATARVR